MRGRRGSGSRWTAWSVGVEFQEGLAGKVEIEREKPIAVASLEDPNQLRTQVLPPERVSRGPPDDRPALQADSDGPWVVFVPPYERERRVSKNVGKGDLERLELHGRAAAVALALRLDLRPILRERLVKARDGKGAPAAKLGPRRTGSRRWLQGCASVRLLFVRGRSQGHRLRRA